MTAGRFTSMRARCECSDPGCPVHRGQSTCPGPATYGVVLYRADMEDRTGTRMCPGCAEDAMGVGVFYAK